MSNDHPKATPTLHAEHKAGPHAEHKAGREAHELLQHDDLVLYTPLLKHGTHEAFSGFAVHGIEAIGRLYQYDIGVSLTTGRLGGDGIAHAAYLQLREKSHDPETPSSTRVVSGLISNIQSLGRLEDGGRDRALYRFTLVPHLWVTTLQKRSRTFVDQTTLDIIQQVLAEYSPNYKLTPILGGTLAGALPEDQYPKHELVCQYDETDFDFISRLLEREGWYYYFVQPEHVGRAEELHITDNQLSVPVLFPVDGAAANRPDGLIVPATRTHHLAKSELAPTRALDWFHNRLAPLPKQLGVRHRAPDDVKKIHPNAPVKRFDTHAPDKSLVLSRERVAPGEAARISQVRSDEVGCQRRIHEGYGSTAGLMAGRAVWIGEETGEKYLIVCAEHWYQSRKIVGAKHFKRVIGKLERASAPLSPLFDVDGKDAYQVVIECSVISNGSNGHSNDGDGAETAREVAAFRPARSTPIPKMYSTVRGFYRPLKDDGSPKDGFVLDFDESEHSLRLRRELPPGMNFNIDVNSEVLVKFSDGDVDQPYVSGIVPNQNAERGPAPGVLQGARNANGNRNRMQMDDDNGSIALQSAADDDSTLLLGQPGEFGTELRTKKSTLFDFGEGWKVAASDAVHDFRNSHNMTVRVKTPADPDHTTYSRTIDTAFGDIVNGQRSHTTNGASATSVTNDDTHTVGGSRRQTVAANHTVGVGGDSTHDVTGYHSVRVGASSQHNVAANHEITVGGNTQHYVARDHGIAATGHRFVVGSHAVTTPIVPMVDATFWPTGTAPSTPFIHQTTVGDPDASGGANVDGGGAHLLQVNGHQDSFVAGRSTSRVGQDHNFVVMGKAVTDLQKDHEEYVFGKHSLALGPSPSGGVPPAQIPFVQYVFANGNHIHQTQGSMNLSAYGGLNLKSFDKEATFVAQSFTMLTTGGNVDINCTNASQSGTFHVNSDITIFD